jgi:hypothetical protein
MTRNLVAAGFGHGVLTLATVRRQVKAAELEAAPLRGRGLNTILCLTQRADAPGSLARDAAAAAVHNEIQTLREAGAWAEVMPEKHD